MKVNYILEWNKDFSAIRNLLHTRVMNKKGEIKMVEIEDLLKDSNNLKDLNDDNDVENVFLGLVNS